MSVKRLGHSVISALPGILFAFALLCLLESASTQAPAQGGTLRYVSSDGDCGGAMPCYSTIQAAVDAASAGDEIRVAAGTYADRNVRPRLDGAPTDVVTQVVYISQTITLRGGYLAADGLADPPDGRANRTIIDARGQGRGLYITGSISPTIEDLEITGGVPMGDAPPEWEHVGGGVIIITATATLRHNRIYDNAGGDCGGGIYLTHSETTMGGNEVSSNRAIQGAGLCVIDSPVWIDGNAIHDNEAWHGGGVYVDNANLGSSAATFRNNQVLYNTAIGGCGGGFYLRNSVDTWINNVIGENQAMLWGSGLCIVDALPRLLHNTLVGNSGGDGSGVYITNGGLAPDSTVWMTNTILVGHAVGISVAADSIVALEATLWGDGVWANGTDWTEAGAILTGTWNYWGDPAFVQPETGDYHIGRESAAINKGVNAGVTRDIDGDPRPLSAGTDLGADEYGVWINLPLVLR